MTDFKQILLKLRKLHSEIAQFNDEFISSKNTVFPRLWCNYNELLTEIKLTKNEFFNSFYPLQPPTPKLKRDIVIDRSNKVYKKIDLSQLKVDVEHLIKYLAEFQNNSFNSLEKLRNIEETSRFIAIITSTTIELEAVRSTLSEELRLEPKDDVNIYFTGVYKNNHKSIPVILTKSPYMGMAAAATTATKIIMKYKPAYLVMLGIAAGLKSAGLKIGDILISEQTLDYNQVVETQKKENEEEKTVYKDMKVTYNLDGYLKSKFDAYSKNEKKLAEIKSSFSHNTLFENSIQVKIGKLVSGSALLRSDNKIEQIKKDNQGVIGIDMESYAVFYSANNTSKIVKPRVVSIKSVSDYGDTSKHKKEHTVLIRQKYAAHTSALFFKNFALDELENKELKP